MININTPPKAFLTADVQWEAEPDISLLRSLYEKLETDSDQAIKGLEILVIRGSVAAALYLGVHFQHRSSCVDDQEAAARWYSRAAHAGVRAAWYQLGVLKDRLGDRSGAKESFANGAKQNYQPCLYRLACIESDNSNYAESRRLMEISAANGHLYSMRDLSYMLISGRFGWRQAIRGVGVFMHLCLSIIVWTIRCIRYGVFYDENIWA